MSLRDGPTAGGNFKTEDGKLHQALRAREEWVPPPEGTYPRLVDDLTWQAAQQVKAQNRATATRSSKTPEAFLLRAGLVRCAVCGWSMAARQAGNRKAYRYYCIGKAHGREVPADVRGDLELANVSVPSQVLDKAVWDHVAVLIQRPEYLDQAIARLQAEDPTYDDTAALDARAAQIRGEMENYAAAIATSASPQVVTMLTARMDDLARTLQEIERERLQVTQRGQRRAQARAYLGQLQPRRKRRSLEMPQYHVEATIPLDLPSGDSVN